MQRYPHMLHQKTCKGGEFTLTTSQERFHLPLWFGMSNYLISNCDKISWRSCTLGFQAHRRSKRAKFIEILPWPPFTSTVHSVHMHCCEKNKHTHKEQSDKEMWAEWANTILQSGHERGEKTAIKIPSLLGHKSFVRPRPRASLCGVIWEDMHGGMASK